MKTKFLALASSFVLLFSCNENSIDESINDLDRFRNEISFEAYYNSKLSPLGEIKLDEAKQSTSKQGDTYFVTPIKKSEKLTGAVYSARMSDGSYISYYVSSIETVNFDGWYHFYDNDFSLMQSIEFESKAPIQFKEGVIQGRTNASCVGNCYDTVMSACDADPDCQLLCDGLDLILGICTIEVIIACAIHCAIQ